MFVIVFPVDLDFVFGHVLLELFQFLELVFVVFDLAVVEESCAFLACFGLFLLLCGEEAVGAGIKGEWLQGLVVLHFLGFVWF